MKKFKEQIWPLKSLDISLVEHLLDDLDEQVRSMNAPLQNLHDVKDLLLKS